MTTPTKPRPELSPEARELKHQILAASLRATGVGDFTLAWNEEHRVWDVVLSDNIKCVTVTGHLRV